MEKVITLKFKASNVDIIEQAKKMSIEHVIGDTTISNIAYIVSQAYVNEDGKIGIAKSKAMEKIDEYLETYDKEELMIDITEGLVKSGFLPKEIDVEVMRNQKIANGKKLKETMSNI